MTRGAAHAQVTKVVVTAGANVVATASADVRDLEDPKEPIPPLLSDESFRGLQARVRALEETPDTEYCECLAFALLEDSDSEE